MHCQEGNGRTGIFVCSLLCLLFRRLSVVAAAYLFNRALDERVHEQRRRRECQERRELEKQRPEQDPRHFPHNGPENDQCGRRCCG